MKHNFLRFLTLTALIFGSLSLWAGTQYCGDVMTSNTGWPGTYNLSISKSGDTQTQIIVSVASSEEITGFYQFLIQNAGGGSASKTEWNPNDSEFTTSSNFSVASDKKSATILVNWTKYPTSDVQFHMILRRNNDNNHGGGSDIFGNTLGGIDVSASCGDGDLTPSDLTITSSTELELEVSATSQISHTTSSTGKITYKSSNDGVATVSASGLITAIKGGKATITVAQEADNTYAAGSKKINVNIPRISQCSGDVGHFGNPNVKRIHYEIEYKDNAINYIVTGLNSHKIDFLEVQTTKGNYSATITNGIGTYKQTGATKGEDLGIRFLYSTDEIGGNEMNSENVSLDDPNIIYYKVGDCEATDPDLEDPNLTITTPATSAIELAINATQQIEWTSSNTATPTFASSNSAAVEVSAAGLITAKAIGSATITVKQAETDTYQEATQTITVTVAGDKSKNTECSGWDNEKSQENDFVLGYNYEFKTENGDVIVKFEFFDEDINGAYLWDYTTGTFSEKNVTYNNKVVTYSYTQPTTATVKFAVKVTRTVGMSVTKQFTYHVGEDCQPHPVTGVSITSTFTEIEVGQAMTMTAAVTPANATNKNVTWSITSGSGAFINTSTGLLTGEVAGGSVTVQVMTEDGDYTATKTITVIAAKPSAPSALPTAPTLPANKVKAVYSATYSADCGFGEWGSSTAYTQDTYGKKYVMTGSGYFGMEIAAKGSGLNCSSMEYLHADVWVKDNKSIRFVPIHGGTEYGVTKQLTGGQWNSIDIALNEGDWANITNWSDVYQIKIDNAPYLTLWFNNVYFYTTAEETKYAVSAIAGDGGSATVSASSVTSGTEVTFTATAKDCGYMFSSWTKGGEVIVGAGATYTTAITEETTLTANFTTTFAPVTPTHDAANVMTVYGDYGKQTGLNVSPWWDPQTTQYNETTIGDKKMARYTNINFQGWDFDANRMDVSDMQYVHIDLYASVESNIMFALIWQGDEHSVTKHLNGCTMESLDIPLSEFTNADLTTIRQLKFDAQGLPLAGHVLIVQNIYFYKLPPAPVESVTITNAPSEMAVNSDLTLTATIAPVNAGNKNVTWTIIAGEDNANIDASTGLLHATSAGQVTVQVTTEDGHKTDSKTITIKDAEEPVFPFTDDPTNEQITQLSEWLSYYYGQTVDFTLPRSLSSSYFNTICLPFGLSSFAGTPFEGATVATLVDATVEGIDLTLALTLVFQPVTSMVAGVPYIIQPASDLINPRFDDVTISATEAGHTVAGNADFVGSLAPINVKNSRQNVFLAANNTLMWNNIPATIKGYRGYFAITGVTATSPMRANAPRLVIRNTPTEMQNAESTLRSEKVIRNGQLVIIRNGVEYNAQGQVIQ